VAHQRVSAARDRLLASLGIATAALALAGCGLGAGAGTSDVTLRVTRSFGASTVGRVTARNVPGSETVIRMLERHFRVGLRYGGGFVESINGLSGSSSHLDWFYYVNGIQASVGGASTAVHRGDEIWWDLHDWSATNSVPAVVGSFPEPFLHGSGGKRYPVVVECAGDVSQACRRVSGELESIGVPFASQVIGGSSGTDSLTLVVGTWHDVAPEVVGTVIGQGPRASGVYARFTAGGSALALLNPRGEVVRRLTAGAGLIAATSQNSSLPTWLVTGTDVAGVSDAASALKPSALQDHFALAVQGSSRLPVPLESTT
jgi:Domain of unknown function (DUF4430)